MKATMKRIAICLIVVVLAITSTNEYASAAKRKYTATDLKLLTCIIYCESGNQSYKGKVAVADVVLNRVDNKRFPKTIKAVIYQKSQFTPARSGSLARAIKMYEGKIKYGRGQKKQMDESKKAAKAALAGKHVLSKNYLFFTGYRSKKTVLKKYPRAVFIGGHYFR